MVTEVKPKHSFESITPQHIKLEGFDIYSNFEDNEAKRGIAIYISHRISDRVTELKVNTDFRECVWLNLSLRGRDKLLMGCIYRSPSSITENDYNLWNMLKSITEANPSYLVIAGDFNYPDINWDTVESVKHSEHTSQRFIDAVMDSFLHQHVTQPTRYHHEQNPSTLDLLLTSEENMINHINYLPGLGLIDHVCIFFELSVYIAKPEQS